MLSFKAFIFYSDITEITNELTLCMPEDSAKLQKPPNSRQI